MASSVNQAGISVVPPFFENKPKVPLKDCSAQHCRVDKQMWTSTAERVSLRTLLIGVATIDLTGNMHLDCRSWTCACESCRDKRRQDSANKLRVERMNLAESESLLTANSFPKREPRRLPFDSCRFEIHRFLQPAKFRKMNSPSISYSSTFSSNYGGPVLVFESAARKSEARVVGSGLALFSSEHPNEMTT
jgi:hypothetical protein